MEELLEEHWREETDEGIRLQVKRAYQSLLLKEEINTNSIVEKVLVKWAKENVLPFRRESAVLPSKTFESVQDIIKSYHLLLRYKLCSSSGPTLPTNDEFFRAEWRLDYILRNSAGVAVTAPLYTISFGNQKFQCTKSELKDLLFKVQDAKTQLAAKLQQR